MKKSLILAVAFSLVSVAPISAASIAAGQKCPKASRTTMVNGVKLICVKSGSKLIWRAAPKVSAPQPTPNVTATPSISPATTPSTSPAEWREYSSSEVVLRAKEAIATYLAIKRTPSQVVTVLVQDGVDLTLKNWISQGATLVAQSFSYPASTRPFYDVVALDRKWLEETYKKAGFSEVEVRDRLGGFDAKAPAFGGTTTNTWNAKTIADENLLVRDKVGMAQTSGHEFFHTIQERLAGRNPGRDGEQIPNWFWEGPAMFVGIHAASVINAINFDIEGRKAALDRFNNGRPETKPLLLKDVKANDGITDPYGIGYAATEYLIAQVGVEKFLNVYAELGKGKSFERAFSDATGFTLETFYSHFEKNRAALGFPRS